MLNQFDWYLLWISGHCGYLGQEDVKRTRGKNLQNNRFGSKERNMAFYQVKISMYEYDKTEENGKI